MNLDTCLTNRIWRRCHVECGRKCVRGRNAAARTLLSHPTPPQPPASGDDAMLSVAASVPEEGTQLPGRYYPTPHRVWRRCYVDCGRNCDADVGFWVMRMVVGNGLFLVAKSSCFGCGIAFFWLRNRLFLVAESVIFGCGIGSFLVAEAPFFGCGSVSDFGCGIAEIWLRKRRNMVSESDFILKGSSTWDVLPHVLVKSKLHWLLCIMEADLCHWFMAWISAVQLPNHGQRGLISWDCLQFPTVSHSFPVLHQGFSSKMICIAPRSPTEPGDPVCYWILLLLSIYCL